MSEHRRKPPQSQEGGRAAARRGQSGPSSGRRAAPRGATGSPADSYGSTGSGSPGAGGAERPYGGRAEARRAAQRGGRRRGADIPGPGRRGGAGGPAGPSRGRGRATTAPGKKRLIDYPRAGKYGWRRWVPSWKLVSGLSIGFLGCLVALVGIGFAMVRIPSENVAAESQNNVYYWADGSQMVATGTGVNRQNITIDKIPQAMQNAVISAENKSFYQDSGVDPMGIARALANMARGGQTQGGSTITQQFVKNTYLSQDQTVTRKFKELFISVKVGTKLKKPQILQGYLNTSYYGRGAYGIQAAARTYFGKDAVDLKPTECALLASLLKGPTYYDPAGNPDFDKNATREANLKRSHDRWSWILGEMHKDGHLTDAQYQTAISHYPTTKGRKATKGMTGQISYLVDTAKKYVLDHSDITRTQFDRGGYQIYTTFDKKKVNALSASVKKIQKTRLHPQTDPHDTYVQFGAASVKPNDGAIVALYGGPGYENGHFTNNADSQGVPVGSTWKPFVLAAAMEYGTYRDPGVPVSPLSKYNGNDLIKIKKQDGSYFLNKDNTVFRQKNEGTKDWGYITLRKAMEQSINSPFVQLGVDVGMTHVRDVAESAGIPAKSMAKDLNPSFAIGTSTPSAISMADAYGTFAASGKQVDPYSVTAVKHNGEELQGFSKPKVKQAMDANIANNVTDVLENVIQNGTATKAQALGRTAAGKTGTTDDNKSAWFVGYTPQLSTAVTMFRENPKKPGLMSMNGTAGVPSIHGGDIPTLVWTEYMKDALKGASDTGFPEATKIGEPQNEPGALSPSPTPSPTPTPSETQSNTPSPTPSDTGPSPTPTPSDTCQFGWGNNCNGNGGTGPGGTDGGTSPSPTATETTGNGNTRGNGNGGIFAGPTG
ncbi:transglycosylase domain-containing protein [Streptomyces sp. L2]|uniref:transglycosylase domain-containing protein n=1 Tax=Streptomyces sp. L2 TaxID=2162665 RepID=UPI0019D6FFA1|nr:transglycosylase domain-containing protein [Streptomyces sp. L2]